MNMNPGPAGLIGILIAFPTVALIAGEINHTTGAVILTVALLITLFLTGKPDPYEGKDK